MWFHSLRKHSKEELLPFTHQPWVNCGPWDHTVISSGNYWCFEDVIMQPGFDLYLTWFARKWYRVKIQSPKAWWTDTEDTLLWCLWLLRGNSCDQLIYFLWPGHMLVASKTISFSTWTCGYHQTPLARKVKLKGPLQHVKKPSRKQSGKLSPTDSCRKNWPCSCQVLLS